MSNPITDLKHELLAAAERRYVAPARPRRFGGRVVVVRLALLTATVAIAAAVALFITTPWSSSPSFLAQAEAALTQPKGMILHEKWVATSTNSCNRTSATEVWLDSKLADGQRYRAFVLGPIFRDPALHPWWWWCSRERVWEIGGVVDGYVIRFVPPNRLVNTYLGGAPPELALMGEGEDPVAALRHAIRTGKARDEGKTKRDGRTVEYIRVRGVDAYDYYVDPYTFYPVEVDLPGYAEIHYLAYEYLPRTAANLALTSLRAQHPHATGP
jgi:hypothetical protein